MTPPAELSGPLPAPAPESVAVGRVVRAHGLLGEVVVEPLTDRDRRFAPKSRLEVRFDPPAAPAAPVAPVAPVGRRSRWVEVTASRPFGRGFLIRFAGVADRDGAEALRGAWLEVPRSEVPPAEPGTYYHFELLGCACFESGRPLGEVVDLVEDGGGLLLIVEGEGRRLPIPFVARSLAQVDIAARRIELDLPEGLIEACASRS